MPLQPSRTTLRWRTSRLNTTIRYRTTAAATAARIHPVLIDLSLRGSRAGNGSTIPNRTAGDQCPACGLRLLDQLRDLAEQLLQIAPGFLQLGGDSRRTPLDGPGLGDDPRRITRQRDPIFDAGGTAGPLRGFGVKELPAHDTFHPAGGAGRGAGGGERARLNAVGALAPTLGDAALAHQDLLPRRRPALEDNGLRIQALHHSQ